MARVKFLCDADRCIECSLEGFQPPRRLAHSGSRFGLGSRAGRNTDT